MAGLARQGVERFLRTSFAMNKNGFSSGWSSSPSSSSSFVTGANTTIHGMGNNSTEWLPTTLLDAFVPGYSLLSKIFLEVFGFDVGFLVSLCALMFAVTKFAMFAWRKGDDFFVNYLMSSIHIDDSDDLYEHVLEWIGHQRVSQVSRTLKAVTKYDSNQADDMDISEDIFSEGLFNFSRWAAKVPPRYEPYFGRHRFWYKRRLYQFWRSRREVQSSSGWGGYVRSTDEELIQIACVGRSTEPIKQLIADIKIWALEKEHSMTVIKRPTGKDRGRGPGSWDRVSSRPSRSMDTVSLDPDQKASVIEDVNEFLHPMSPRWYANRGIPYRRGYLFHGPPGTGKTSLSFALAGIFGLDIYVISLLDPTLTESDLNRLFNKLPKRCIVLLEDIDTAGLNRSDTKVDPSSNSASSGPINASDLAKAIKSASKGDKTDESKQGISLSGLLNAIDGVASQEGRVLVMTTNFPEKLDPALTRPGRIDMQVEFTLATQGQAKDIFLRMYSADESLDSVSYGRTRKFNASAKALPTRTIDDQVKAKAKARSEHLNGFVNVETYDTDDQTSADESIQGLEAIDELDSITPTTLKSLASSFATKIPERTFSPAELQGYLLMRKKQPQRAVSDLDEWKKGVLTARTALEAKQQKEQGSA